jgi:hypothetical protein
MLWDPEQKKITPMWTRKKEKIPSYRTMYSMGFESLEILEALLSL